MVIEYIGDIFFIELNQLSPSVSVHFISRKIRDIKELYGDELEM